MTHDGWRKPTPALLQAQQYAKVGEGLSIPKSRAIAAAKRIGAALGLKSQDLLLLDTFGAFSQSQDWEEGRRPIIWASNNYLMDQTGFSLTTLKRHIKRLADVGVIAFKDSVNGKRYGHRGDDGYIKEAYGFDLAPLAARTEEFEARYARIKEEREFCASLRQAITISRRTIRSQIDRAIENALRGPWRALQDELEQLLELLPKRNVASNKLLKIADMFVELKQRVEAAFSNAFDWPETNDDQNLSSEDQLDNVTTSFNKNMYPSGSKNGPHILTTNQPHPVTSNSFEDKDAADIEQNPDRGGDLDSSDDINLDINWNLHRIKRKSEIDIPMLMVACPHFAELARDMGGGYIRNWNDMHRAAAQIRGMAGISQDAWNVANKILGPERAAATIALIFDKQTTGEVKSAGGYLRAMVERAQSGELHLDRSFFGRLSEARVLM